MPSQRGPDVVRKSGANTTVFALLSVAGSVGRGKWDGRCLRWWEMLFTLRGNMIIGKEEARVG